MREECAGLSNFYRISCTSGLFIQHISLQAAVDAFSHCRKDNLVFFNSQKLQFLCGCNVSIAQHSIYENHP